jgi:hypothetical protein
MVGSQKILILLITALIQFLTPTLCLTTYICTVSQKEKAEDKCLCITISPAKKKVNLRVSLTVPKNIFTKTHPKLENVYFCRPFSEKYKIIKSVPLSSGIPNNNSPCKP